MNKIVDAAIVEIKLFEFCKTRTKTKTNDDCNNCPIKECCHAFLDVTTTLDLSI